MKKPGKDHGPATPDRDQHVRLNKFLANCGICSRREADNLILQGLVTVNGQVVTALGSKVLPTDEILFKGKKLSTEKLRYVLLNKPRDFITTTKDERDRKTVMQLVATACEERIYPVGRLDRNTTGLLLLTNDGELADKLMHPSKKIVKIYKVDLDKPLTENDFNKIVEGTELEDGLALVDELSILTKDKKELGIEIHMGKNRIVRRIFEHYGYEVIRLDRVAYAGLDKKDLPRGKWRYLNEKELIRLKHLL
ncbi:MAG: rRNA pseudouridine synthase [Cyclobacteriaceae bacterium]|nr:rRNA pseudouridine synthase [Cyclobacteriaceae bacterium]